VIPAKLAHAVAAIFHLFSSRIFHKKFDFSHRSVSVV